VCLARIFASFDENSFKGQQILDLNRGHPTDILEVWAQQVPSKSSKTKRAPKPKKDDVAAISAKETAKAEFLDEDEPQLNFQAMELAF